MFRGWWEEMFAADRGDKGDCLDVVGEGEIFFRNGTSSDPACKERVRPRQAVRVRPERKRRVQYL